MSTASEWPSEMAASGAGGADAGVDLRRVFLNHKLLLLAALAGGAGLGYLQCTREQPVYASGARVLAARNPVRLPMDGTAEFSFKEDPLDRHTALLRTPVILQKAVEEYSLDQLDSLAGTGNPVAALAAALAVTRSEESDEILYLTYRSTDRYDCQKVLNAVIAAYIDWVIESQQSFNEGVIRQITEAKEDLLETLEQKERNYADFREKTSLLWHGEEGLNKHQMRLAQIEDAQAQLQIERSRLRAELQVIEEALERGENRQALLLMATQARQREPDPEPKPEPESESEPDQPPLATAPETAAAITGQLIPLLVEEQMLLERYGPEHPTILAHRKKIETTRGLLEEVAGSEPEPPPPPGEPVRRPDLLSIYVDSLRQELAVIDQKAEEFERLNQDERQAAMGLSQEENRNRAMREDIERTKRLFEVVLEQLQKFNLDPDRAFLAVSMVEAPGPGAQVAPVMSEYVAFGGVLGLLAGIALAFLIESSDKSFRGPEQIMKQMNLPVIGHIPTIRTGRTVAGSTLSPTLVAYHRPRSRLAEAYRAIRVPLLFGARQESLKVIQVTSPDPGDGKSTLSANLAIVMANSGKKCLLIDADFRRPQIHRLFGLSNEIGLSSVIEGDVELADAIQSCAAENLDLLPCGGRPHNAAELILSPRFEEALSVLREKYDFVILDTPPVLAVTDPSAVASRVDAVLLVIRITKRVRLHAVRARETLGLIGAKVLGVVVNGIGESSAYAYGTGVYSYRSSQYQYSKSPYGMYQDYGYGSYYAERDDGSESNGHTGKPDPAVTVPTTDPPG